MANRRAAGRPRKRNSRSRVARKVFAERKKLKELLQQCRSTIALEVLNQAEVSVTSIGFYKLEMPEVKTEFIEVEESKIMHDIDPACIPTGSGENPIQYYNIQLPNVGGDNPLDIASTSVPQLDIVKSEPLDEPSELLDTPSCSDFDNFNGFMHEQLCSPSLLIDDLENFGATIASELRLINHKGRIRRAKIEILQLIQKYQEEDERK